MSPDAREETGPPAPRATAALALIFLSGAAALAHQLLWTRRLVDLFGAGADTFSKVVGAFFLGLALGGWLAAVRPGAARSAWRRVALAELFVALLALPALFSIHWIEALPRGAGAQFILSLALPLLLIAPPAVAMGLVLPWVVRALAAAPGFDPGLTLRLYALNTLGGVAGIAAVVFYAVAQLGLQTAGLAAAALNGLIALGFYVLHRRTVRGACASSQTRGGASSDPLSPHRMRAEGRVRGELRSFAAPSRSNLAPAAGGAAALSRGEDSTPAVRRVRCGHAVLAFSSGFLVLALEVVMQHQLAQVSINSFFSSATVLAMVLVALGLAAAMAPRVIAWTGGFAPARRWALTLGAAACVVQPFVFIAFRPGLSLLPYELAPLPYTRELGKLGLATVIPVFLAAGLVFPLVLRQAVAGGGPHAGRQAGLLLAINGIGGWLGAELTQGLIAPALGLWQTMTLAGLLYYLLRLAGRDGDQPQANGDRLLWFGPRAFGIVLVGLAWALTARLPQAGLAPDETLVAARVGREGVVATVRAAPDDWRMLFNNSYTLGGSRAQANQERQAHLPILLHGDARTVALLGVATASTAAGASLHPQVERVDAAELSGLVLRFAREHFAPFNRGVFGEPRVRMIHADARRMIAGREAAYDVIVGDLFLPWRTGEGRLFSREHFTAVRRALRPDGLFCQWLPMFQLTRPQFDAIARTYREVFPDAFLVRGDFYAELPILGLVGGREFAGLDWRRVAGACARLRGVAGVRDPLARHVEGVAMLVLGPLPDPGAGPVNTLGNAWLEWDAGRNILGMRTPWFIGVPCAEYVRDVQRAGHPLLPAELRAAHQAGQFFLTLEIAAKINLPQLDRLKAQIPERLAPPLRDDRDADWRHWPMRIKPGP